MLIIVYCVKCYAKIRANTQRAVFEKCCEYFCEHNQPIKFDESVPDIDTYNLVVSVKHLEKLGYLVTTEIDENHVLVKPKGINEKYSFVDEDNKHFFFCLGNHTNC